MCPKRCRKYEKAERARTRALDLEDAYVAIYCSTGRTETKHSDDAGWLHAGKNVEPK